MKDANNDPYSRPKEPRISVRGIVTYGGNLLCVRQKQYAEPDSPPNNFWNTPGGGLDAGESLEVALTREMIEETGVPPTIGSLLYVQQFRHNKREYIDFFFHVTNGRDYVFIDLAKTSHGEAEIAEIGFIDVTELPVMPNFLQSEIPLLVPDGATKLFSYL
jgi:ADP-ribose pyrophosphatase YjhB (NUDIX family)